MTLLEALSRIDGARPAIIGPNGRHSFAELSDRARALMPEMEGARVVINSTDLVQAIVVLACADGIGEAVALISPHHNSDVVVSLTKTIAPDVVLSDNPAALFAAGLSVPAVTNPSELVEALGRSARGTSDTTRWIITTSGTTSTPKLVEHSLASLTRTTRCDTERGHGQVWGVVYDYTRFAGLQVVLQSLLSGACLALPDHQADIETQLKFLADVGCTHISATPTMWRKILMTTMGPTLNLRQVTLGGEIADNAILESLARTYPNARISHIFASTEAGVGFSVSDRQAGFPIGYLTDPPSGIGLKIEADRLWVRNSEVGEAYLDGRGVLGNDGWVDTGDIVEKSGDRVYFKGRETGVINVGGNKVHPEVVENAILAHPHIVMARVYAKANPIMGAVVMADIVPEPYAPQTIKQDLDAFLRARIEKHMIPALFRVSESFEVNSAGKVQRDS
mgnify:CR=1 FL=1